MSKTEDYLDNLLNAVEHGEQSRDAEEASIDEIGTGTEKQDAMEDFFDDFEKELMDGINDEDFLRDFERELAEEEAMETSGQPEHVDPFFDNLDGIVNRAKADMKEKDTSDDDFMIDTLGDMPDEDELLLEENQNENQQEDVQLDPELIDLLKSEGEFLDISGNQQENTEDSSVETMGMDDGITDIGIEEMSFEDAGENEVPKEKESFLQKVSRVLFGEDNTEEDKEEPVKEAPASPVNRGELSDENLQILQELEGMPETEPQMEPEEPIVEKKKEKKEKKKKEKKPKEKKPKKEKKLKLPKEPDNTPPLPKKPVILTFAMAASFLVLVLLGTNLFGYTNSMNTAKRNYDMGNYEQALQEVFGMEIKEEDFDTYQKFWLMANASSQYTAYQSFMEAGIYDMALDSLIRAIGKCEKYRPDAEVYGCVGELDKVENQAIGALSSFGISKEQALELSGYGDRTAYSVEIYNILTKAGLEVAE